MDDAQKKRHIIKVGEAEVDVSGIPALTLGDRIALKAAGVDFLKYARDSRMDPEDEVKMVVYLLRKFRPETTEDEVKQISAMVSSSFLQFFMRRSAEVDDPFSTRSTSSQKSTDGASAKSDDSATASSGASTPG